MRLAEKSRFFNRCFLFVSSSQGFKENTNFRETRNTVTQVGNVTPDRARSAAAASFLGFNAFQVFQKISLFGLKLPSFVIF